MAVDNLDTEKQKENNPVAPSSVVGAPPCSFPQQDIDTPIERRDRKFANRAFNLLTYLGLGFVANSTLSLFITYNTLPTDTAQRGIHALKKGFEPIVSGWDKLKGAVGLGSKLAEMNHDMRQIKIGESARSMAELLCMAIAGTVMLFPMKWIMEDRKSWWVDKIDRWRNPDYYRYCEQNNIEPNFKDSLEAKQTWGKLIAGRLVGLGTVIGIDQGIQLFNNHQFGKDKGNFDTMEWGAGSWVYNKLPERLRSGMISFFSRKGVDIEGIQPTVQKRLLQKVDAPPELIEIAGKLAKMREDIRLHPSVQNAPSWNARRKAIIGLEDSMKHERKALLQQIEGNAQFREIAKRAIFSEQTRLFSKEVSLTLVMAGLVFAVSTTGVLGAVLAKFGFKPKDMKKETDTLLEDVPLISLAHGEKDKGVPVKRRITPREKTLPPPPASHTQRLAEAEQSAQLQPGM